MKNSGDHESLCVNHRTRRKEYVSNSQARFSCLISLSGRYRATVDSKLFTVRTVIMRLCVVFTPVVIQVTSVLLSDFFMGLIPSKLFFKPKMHKIGHFAFHEKMQPGFSKSSTTSVRYLDETLYISMINWGEVCIIWGDIDASISMSRGNSAQREAFV